MDAVADMKDVHGRLVVDYDNRLPRKLIRDSAIQLRTGSDESESVSTAGQY